MNARIIAAVGLLGSFLSGSAAAEIPEDQLNDVQLLRGEPNGTEWRAAQIRLQKVIETDNDSGEALAQHLIKACQKEPNLLSGARMLLEVRSFEFGEKREIVPKIDGPYLKELARLSVPGDAPGRPLFRHYMAVAYFKLHPEDKGETYWRLRLAATRDARVDSLPKGERLLLREGDLKQKAIREFVREHHPLPRRDYSLDDAWAILTGIGVLKAGMTVEEASVFLGEPTGVSGRYVRWYHNTPRHVNPCLIAEVEDGKIVRFRNTKA